MAANTITRGRLRRLAELQPERGRVLSVFMNLDPSEFATAPARASQIGSLVNEARKAEEALEGLDHDERVALRADIDRLRDLLQPYGLAAGGARGLALYVCGPADLLEFVRLPQPLGPRVVIDTSPYVEPLAALGAPVSWCVALVSRRRARIFASTESGLQEVETLEDDVHGWHDQGGWSQARYQRSIQNQVEAHLDKVAELLFRRARRTGFTRLVIGAPEELANEVERRLHPELQGRLAGRVHVDIDSANADAVFQAAAPVIEEDRRRREREALERLAAGVGRGDQGRAVGGLADTLAALNEARVELLLLEPGYRARGWRDPATGTLSAERQEGFEEIEDVTEPAIEKAIEQSAELLVIQNFPNLGAHGGIGALLRF